MKLIIKSHLLRAGLVLFVIVLLAVLCPACRVVQTAADIPGKTVRAVTPGQKAEHGVDPVQLQERLFRFSDEALTLMVRGVENLGQGTNALDAAAVLGWKISLGTAITSIATGQNSFANVLDMTVFVTVTRTTLEDHWQPEVFGASAQPLLEASRTAETNIWQLADTILKPEQRTELHDVIEKWHQQNPEPGSFLAARAVGFSSEIAQAQPGAAAKPGSVFGLLNLDPFAGLDPATRELAQTRLFGERALFLAQHMPTLLRWQTELLALSTTELPDVRQLVTNSTQIAASVQRFAGVAEKLPDQLSAEREQILKTLQSQEQELAGLTEEVRQTLLAGSQMSTSLNTTITTFDALMKRFGVGETNSAPSSKTNSEPFRILDYKETAAQLQATARQLTELLLTFDQTIGSTNLAQLSAQVEPVIQQGQAGGKEIVDYVFRKIIILILVVLVAALVHRFLHMRLFSGTRSQKSKS